MDWTQVYTIIATTLGGTIGACAFFYIITAKRIDRTDQMIDINNKNHREDMKKMENFHREDMATLNEKFIRMEEKWERLFERLFFKDQGKAA